MMHNHADGLATASDTNSSPAYNSFRGIVVRGCVVVNLTTGKGHTVRSTHTHAHTHTHTHTHKLATYRGEQSK